MKILGLDVGEKRIGVARVDSATRIAVPVSFIEVNGNEWQELARLTNLHNTKFFVIGLPRSNEGNETKQSLYARNFAKILTEKIPGAKIRFQDESLTSVEAESRLKSRQKKYEKGDIDAEAASIILQDFIETFSEEDSGKDEPLPGVIEENARKVVKKARLNSKKAIESSKKIVKKT
ncbi:Holliday junction resolvase RuvX, partial [Ralstonia pseudosolanacearum]|uniref:Holliday junction resolvase RuvX n=1 Tax=Ralstonia pseudosolanacearum TaxID=1310165 RepID=UPI003D17A9B3